MSLPDDLIAQAVHLATLENQGSPKQASLRRAVSAAYYAVFHQLTESGADACSPAKPAQLRTRVRRAFEHGKMKQFCAVVKNGSKLPSSILPLLAPATSFSMPFVQIAAAFVDLQDARHTADYDLSYKHSRAYADQQIRRARNALATWRTVEGSPEANIFLAAMLFGEKWGR